MEQSLECDDHYINENEVNSAKTGTRPWLCAIEVYESIHDALGATGGKGDFCFMSRVLFHSERRKVLQVNITKWDMPGGEML